MNVSNRFVDLVPVVDGECRALGKTDRYVETDDDASQGLLAAAWMLVTSPATGFDKVVMDGSTGIGPGREIRLWTDDYSNLFQILK